MRSGVLLVFALSASAIAACSSSAEDAPAASGDASPTTVVKEDPTDIPLRAASAAERSLFVDGDIRFDEPFRDTDGVGPVFIRTACGACHEAAGKGPGTVVKMVVIDADGVTPAKDQSLLPYGNTVRPYTAGAATTALLAPEAPQVKQTTRVPPAVFGRGYLEAVDDAEIERVEAEQKARTDGIHGQIHRVTYPSETSADEAFHTHKKGDANLIGRFGLKARQATLDDFTADAYQGDMGITSPLRPTELPNPDKLTDDSKPGVDIDVETVRLVARYMRLLEIPRRKTTAGSPGEKLFADSKCAVCHVPTMKTRASYPIAPLAGIDAPVFTDLLLHDLGPAMSDGLTDGGAGPSQWKTAPLIGLRFMRNYLHDGRARTVEAAILGHEGTASEANASISLFRALSDADRATLVEYVEGLLPASGPCDREAVAPAPYPLIRPSRSPCASLVRSRPSSPSPSSSPRSAAVTRPRTPPRPPPPTTRRRRPPR